MRALSIIFAIIEVCSRTPAIFVVNPFWTSASMMSFCLREEKMESRKQEVRTFRAFPQSVALHPVSKINYIFCKVNSYIYINKLS